MAEVRKWNYGEYDSENYGAHSIAMSIGDLSVWFSYDTVVAFRAPCGGLKVSENDWGTTTGKHLNWINPDKKKRLGAMEFKAELEKVLKKHNLVL